jgi:DNA (cytosine-5)-methyltransferase 1
MRESKDGGGKGPLLQVDRSAALATANSQTLFQPIGALTANAFSGGATGRPEGAAAGHFIPEGMAVRRLTPRECERLQGFPDDYTAIPGAADGPRYKALGNSMPVPVMRWIGKRIQMVEECRTEL